MGSLDLPFDIVNDTPADAVPVDTNYKRIEQHVNTELINRDGSVKMTGPLTLAADPLQDKQAATKSYVDAMLPIGVMLPWVGLNAPAGVWHLADGSSLQIAQYRDLYNVIGGRFGSSAGAFKLPNMAGVVPIGIVKPVEGVPHARYHTIGNYGGTVKVPVPKHHHTMAHDHPSTATSDDLTTHVHAITHNHGTFDTGVAGEHTHSGEFTSDLDTAGSDGWVARRIADTGSAAQITASGTGDHKHAIDVPQYVGDSGAPKTKHKHNVDIGKYTGDTGDYELKIKDADNDESSTDFYAPFVVINYIVRIA